MSKKICPSVKKPQNYKNIPLKVPKNKQKVPKT